MMLTPTLGSTLALYRKLEREAYRAYHQRDRIHKADHFYNFCVTAHALRDYFLNESGISSRSDRKEFHDRWNKCQVLVATKEIANSSKHFTLRRARKTKRVRAGTSEFLDVYIDGEGEAFFKDVTAPDYFVTLADGSRHDLYAFMDVVLQSWREFLKAHGIRVRRQPLSRLLGRSGLAP